MRLAGAPLGRFGEAAVVVCMLGMVASLPHAACGGEPQAPKGASDGDDTDSSGDRSGGSDSFPEGAGADDERAEDDSNLAGGDPVRDSGGTDWPDCVARPPGSTVRSLPQVYGEADGPTPKSTWVESSVVTAISGGACTVGVACQIYVQDAPSYPSFAASAKRGTKLFVSGSAAKHFVTVRTNDRISLAAWALRYTLGGQNEVLLEVNAQLPGCAKILGAQAPTPVDATLADLTVDAYEYTHGPILVRLTDVGGKAQAPTETFGLFPLSGGSPNNGDGGAKTLVSISPYFLPNRAFTGLAANVYARFATVTGVFGLFVVQGGSKYVQVQPRTTADYPLK